MIQARSLHKSFGGFQALNGLTSSAADCAITGASWLSWDCTIHRLALGHYLIGTGVTAALAAAYLQWFAARERRTLGNLRQLDEF